MFAPGYNQWLLGVPARQMRRTLTDYQLMKAQSLTEGLSINTETRSHSRSRNITCTSMAFVKSVSLLLLLHNAFLLSNCELLDMSFPYENNMITWPGLLAFNISVAYNGSFVEAPYTISFAMKLHEHTGTHIDAPLHFARGGISVDMIPPENLISEAIVLDIREKAAKEKDYEVTVDDLKDWEKENGRIPDGSILFVLTGVGKYWGDFEKYMGGKSFTDFHWPAFGNKSAQWLVDNRKIKGVGLDSRSLDVGSSKSFPAHQILLANNIYGLETVANIEKLPTKGAIVYVMPMKIKGGSGGPTRIIAQTDPTGQSSYHTISIVLVLIPTFLGMMLFM